MDMLEHGLTLGMDQSDLWFDPCVVVIKGMQEKQKEVLDFIRWLAEQGFNSSGGLSNISNGMPKEVRPQMNSIMIAMSIGAGLTSAIVNPCEVQLNHAIRCADVIMNNNLFMDSFLEV
jgi:5-methyltetrahydrofolate corrinoid/iron sulfur protein methyltransferase